MRSLRLPIGLFFCVTAVVTSSTFPASALQAEELRPAVMAPRSVTVAEKRVVTLDPLPTDEAGAQSMAAGAKTVQKTPEDFRQFAAVTQGQRGDVQTLTLRFAAAAKLTTIKSTPDFKVEQGGSCVEGFSFAANSTCTLLVRSTPQGPGHRLGKLEIMNSAEVKPLSVGLGGYGYSPTISFTPSIITTVPGTYFSGAGIISGATNVTVDGGDTLYIADTGNNEVESIDTAGTITNETAHAGLGVAAPISVVVDRSGYLYFTRRAQNYFLNILTNPYTEAAYPSGSSSCAVGSTCGLSGANFDAANLSALALDPSGIIFLNTYGSAARFVQDGSGLLQYIPLITPLNFDNAHLGATLALAVDGSDTLYTYYNDFPYGKCVITGESYYSAISSIYNQTAVAGRNTCGFSGDGGQARGAEIGEQVGQMAFDIAGNLYFSDTLNQRVRRIDNATGIITTIAGNGATGYYGDNGPATAAALHNPTGVGVDSQGQVYILSNSATTGAAQVVRKVGVVGALNLGGIVVGSPSAAQTVTLANTGNSQLDFTHVGFSSGNTSDFVIDPNTTSCNFTLALVAGRSCKIGFIFTPSASGARSAVLSITDDTIAGINTIQLTGVGYTTATLTPASLSFASTNVGSSTAAQTVTLTNTGKGVLTVNSNVLSGAGSSSYTGTSTCPATLAVGGSCTLSITFKPTAVGSLPATLTVSDSAITGYQTVALAGTGVGVAKAALAPTSLTYASTKVGSTSAAQTVTLSNPGTAALTITSISMTGTNAADYSFTKTCVTTLAPGASCAVTVSFKPTATGTRTATVSAVTSAATVTAAVTGMAVAAAATPKVTLLSAANPLMTNAAVVLTARVAGPSEVIPAGHVQLVEAGKRLADGVLRNGSITFSMPGMSRGKHMLQAVYLGDSRNNHSSSAVLAQMVMPGLPRWTAAPPVPSPGRTMQPGEHASQR